MTRITREQVDDAISAYIKGESLLTISKRNGLGKGSVANVLRKCGVQLRPRGRRNSNAGTNHNTNEGSSANG
jgi:hypothetical protein